MAISIDPTARGVLDRPGEVQHQGQPEDFELPDPTQEGTQDIRYYLELMAKMQAESRAFTAYSNVLKTRHDAAMSAVRNTRS